MHNGTNGKAGPAAPAASAKLRRTRVPPPDGPPVTLRSTRGDQKAATLASAEKIDQKRRELGLALTESGWDQAKAVADPGGASWRATYRKHVAHLFAKERSAAAAGGLSHKEAEALKARLAQMHRCVLERDATIKTLEARIEELTAENAKLSRGTRARRKRKALQARQADAADTGSD